MSEVECRPQLLNDESMTLDIEITSPHGTNLMQQVGIPSLKAVADPERSKQFEYSVCSGDIGHRGAAAFSPALVCFKGRGNCEIMIADKDDNFRMSSEECKMQDSFLGMEKQKSNSLILRIRKFIRRFEPDASSDFRTIKRLIQDDISTAYVAQNKSRPLGRFDRAGSRGPLGDTICRGGDEALIRRRRRGHTPLGGLTGSSQNLALLCNTNEGDSKKEDFQGKNHSVKQTSSCHRWNGATPRWRRLQSHPSDKQVLGRGGTSSISTFNSLSPRDSNSGVSWRGTRFSQSARGPLGDAICRDFNRI
mmetsp:Transcript_9228/g.12867  ORF Transcript_9228/g.12867 Transcript_9228/m.12867 type:complete len:306 (+) Transcript_9228:102-1019(+)